jgi:hypothetical protein
MPKAAGAKLQPVRIVTPRPPWKPVKLEPATSGPHRQGLSSTASNSMAAAAVRMAGAPGGINPKQQVF